MTVHVIIFFLYYVGSQHIRPVACSPTSNGLYFLYSNWPKEKIEEHESYKPDDEELTSLDFPHMANEIDKEGLNSIDSLILNEGEDKEVLNSIDILVLNGEGDVGESIIEQDMEVTNPIDTLILNGEIGANAYQDFLKDILWDQDLDVGESIIEPDMEVANPVDTLILNGEIGANAFTDIHENIVEDQDLDVGESIYHPEFTVSGMTDYIHQGGVPSVLESPRQVWVKAFNKVDNGIFNDEQEKDFLCSSIKCPPSKHDPVCDYDGNTHNSFCDMEKIACLVPNENNRMKYPGPCGFKGWMPNMKPPSPPLTCELDCPNIYKPVCDNRGNTHANNCILRYVACMLPLRKITWTKDGDCETYVENVPAHELEIYDLNAQADEPITSQMTCDNKPCPDKLDYVCDTNGNTHDNLCFMLKVGCLVPNENIQLQYPGPCGSHAIGSKANTSSGIDCMLDCPDTYIPICDNRGNTYDNPCLLAYVSCMLPLKKIVMVHTGECGTIAMDESTSFGSKVSPPISCTVSCPEVENPVCDNRGVTHDNECHLVVEACNFQEDKIVMSYPGACREKKYSNEGVRFGGKGAPFFNMSKKINSR